MAIDPAPPLAHAKPVALLEIWEAANTLKISPEHMRRLVRDGRIPVVHFGPRTLRIRPADLTAFIDASLKDHRQPGEDRAVKRPGMQPFVPRGAGA